MAIEPNVYRVETRAGRRTGTEVSQFVRQLDMILLASAAALVAYGLWILQAVTRDDVAGNPDYFFTRQAVYAGLGAVALAVMTAIDPERWRRYRTILFGAVLLLMVAVFVLGPSIRGSRRWFDLGVIQLQPSELAKIALIIFLAGFMADRARQLDEFAVPLAAVGIAAVPILLAFFEPDFGTALVLTAALAGVLVFGGTRWPHLAVIGAAGAGLGVAVLWALPAAGIQMLKPYQTDRLIGFIHPDSDPSGSTYNVNQSITAVGAGGLDGRGVEGATQTNLNYLPEHATDFIFASLAEQRGFLGASILLLLYALVIWRGIKIVAIAPSAYSATVAGAIVTMLLFQIFLNVGMTIGIAPITGITLPFISYGGSSMITSLALIGLLQAIHVRGRLAGNR
jgi:rod shape determining protein RodA